MNTTIKPSHLLLGSVLMFTACSQDMSLPDIEEAGEPIAFRTSLPALSSRTQIVTEENIPYFHVTAFDPSNPDLIAQNNGFLTEYFKNERIEVKNGVDRIYSENCIWPKPGYESHNLTFFAYYPALNNNIKPINGTTVTGGTMNVDYKMKEFSVNSDISKQVDFVTANAIGSMAENLFSGVSLPFRHQLSRVEVKAYSAHKSCNIEIAGVRLGSVYKGGTFDFVGNSWSDLSDKGIVEYIYGKGDAIVLLAKGAASTSTADGAVSIMGNAHPDGNNAMLIPADYATPWDFAGDNNNAKKGMFISVLLRIVDATSSETRGIQQYPYLDLKQGKDALSDKIPRVYLAVDKQTNTVTRNLGKLWKNWNNKNDGNYYIDADLTQPCHLESNEIVKEFGWAALSATGKWSSGYVYTYTLDYTYGIGLHDPEVTTAAPKAGDPIISDKVGINVSVKDWKNVEIDNFEVPGH